MFDAEYLLLPKQTEKGDMNAINIACLADRLRLSRADGCYLQHIMI